METDMLPMALTAIKGLYGRRLHEQQLTRPLLCRLMKLSAVKLVNPFQTTTNSVENIVSREFGHRLR